MTVLVYLIPIALLLGLVALFTFLWALKSGQFDDMDGASSRILFDDEDDTSCAPERNGEDRDGDAAPKP